jgi:hypothetical protein
MTKTKRNFGKNKSCKNKSCKNKSCKSKRKFGKKKSFLKGGAQEECCICDQKIKDKKLFIPSECLMKYGKIRSHKICDDCWWNTFAKEGISHSCPGCKRGLPLHGPPPPKFIDLTED